MTLSEELTWRGFINQTTYSDLARLDEKRPKFYMGFDASADSQAIGNLAAMMFVKVLLRHGLEGYVVAGGSTSLIGDPGGKEKERLLQSEDTIAHNVEKAKEQLGRVLHGQNCHIVNNLDWTKDLKVLPFLRDIGKHFSMTPLVQRDYIAKRIGEGGSGLSYAEFSYTVLQGYDYLHLYDSFGVALQLGGSDQWGNCLSGVELIRRARGAETDVITMNLVINKATGQKFGKSEGGAIWLDENKTSVYQFYQFWLNVDDEMVENYLKIYTELRKDEIEEQMLRARANPELRHAQELLAFHVTNLVHGHEKAARIQKVTNAVFKNDFDDLLEGDFEELKTEVPVIHGEGGSELVGLLVESKLASSNTEARRFIADKAIYVNNMQVTADKTLLVSEDFRGKYALLRRGKNSLALVQR